MADRLLDEIDGSRLHRLNCHRHGTTPGDDDGRELVAFGFKALDQLDTAHAGHQRIDQQASCTVWTVGCEEGRTIGENLHRIPALLKQITHRLADGAVVVDDEYGGRLAPFQT